MSYKNYFIFNSQNGVLGVAKLSLCPRVARLASVIRTVISSSYESLGIPENARVNFSQIFETGLKERLRTAKTVTMAQITSFDYCGEDISEKDFGAYKDFMGGINYDKTTKLHGKKGENIIQTVQFILDDIISGNDFVENFRISMKVDGETIDFSKYFKKYSISVLMDEQNKKYVDYDDLIKKIISAIEQYGNENS